MKKVFPLEVEGKKTPRVIDSIKHEVNKYLKRERRKRLPAGVDYWDFDCRVGTESDSAEVIHLTKISAEIDKISEQGVPSVYIEILSKQGRRKRKAPSDKPAPNTSKKI